MSQKPYIFIGSSTEGLQIAKAIQANLEYTCESHIWSQGLFGLSGGTLETLVNSLDDFDFAILVLTPDDLTISREASSNSPRDNVIFELGLFIGGLSKTRVFMVVNREAKLKLPSDLGGITPATFEMPKRGNMMSALGAACTSIEDSIKKLGSRKGSGVSAHWWTGCEEDRVTERPDFYMTVFNRTLNDLPWLNVHVFPSNSFQLEATTEKKDRLMAGQYAMYQFRMFDKKGKLTKWAQRFLKEKKDELSIRIFTENTADDAVLIDYLLGAELHERIAHYAKV